MKQKKQIIIFTDLDGCLLDKQTFKYDIIENYFKELILEGIIIVLNSSKTEAELIDFNKNNNLDLCFISENGSSIHKLNTINKKFPSKIPLSRSYDDIYKIYNENLSLEIKRKITPILKLKAMDQQKILGLPLDKLPLALKRMHTIPIQFNGSEIEKNNFTKYIHQLGLSVQSGGRILNIGDNTNKFIAMSKILDIISNEIDDEIVTIGVGDNQNDIEMLKHTDYPCLVKNDNFNSSFLNIENLIKSVEPSPKGWADVIKTAIQKINS